jgi:hypothetical protein
MGGGVRWGEVGVRWGEGVVIGVRKRGIYEALCKCPHC